MAESVITVSIITIACVISATMLVSAVYPAVNRATTSMVSTNQLLTERIQTGCEIIAEANNSSYAYIWVKNTGSRAIPQIDKSDLFFGELNNFRRIPFDSACTAASSPCWNYHIENDNNDNDKWDVGETINITINNGEELTPGEYYIHIVLYNGISDEDRFSI